MLIKKGQGFEFEITTHCQASCRSCLRTNPDTGKTVDWLIVHHVPLEDIKFIIDNLDKDVVDFIVLCGEYGDPMMHPQINEIIELITKDYVCEIHTNGGLRNENFYKEHAKNKNLHIQWGIDGLDAETNSKYRENVNFDKAWNNMNAWFNSGGEGQWSFIIFEWNYHQLFKCFGYAIRNKILFKYRFNTREWGLISEENKTALMKDLNYIRNLLWG
jgi:MoaA/NifB/PqqE/SkfB family radical SAM enzyme